MRNIIVTTILIGLGVLGVIIPILAWRGPNRTDPRRFSRRGRSLLLHLVLVVLLPIINLMAFLPLFADHQPFPAPLNNLWLLAILEAIVAIAIYSGFLFWLRKQYRIWMIAPKDSSRLLVLIGVFITLTLLPILISASTGPA